MEFDEIHGESMYKEKAFQLIEEIKNKNLAIVSEYVENLIKLSN